MATHSIIFAWEIPWTEEPGGLQSQGSQESRVTEHSCNPEVEGTQPALTLTLGSGVQGPD